MLIQYFIDRIFSINPNYSPNIILDVGSRDLGQSLEFLSVFPKAKILAFEPNPNQYTVCALNAKGHPQIEVYPYAAADKEGEMSFYVTPSNIGASSLLEPTDVPFGAFVYDEIKVKTISLNSFLKSKNIEKVDIVWMDIQGGELLALKHFTDYLGNVDFLQCEATEQSYYKNHPLKDELVPFIESYGFDQEFYRPHNHPYGEGDLICVNKKMKKIL